MRRILGFALLSAGLACLLCIGAAVAGSLASQGEVARTWERTGVSTSPAESGSSLESGSAPDRVPPAPGTPLFGLEIPRLRLDQVVVEGTGASSLRKGPGHVEGTAYPGENGNLAVAAHRDLFFWRLGEVRAGDTIWVRDRGRRWEYRVVGRRIVSPSDTSVVGRTVNPSLTLITCWPLIYPGDAPERLVISAERIGAAPSE